MTELIKLIIDNIVDESVSIEIESKKENGNEEITVHVPEEYMGKIIGKNGRIAKAIRLIANANKNKDTRKVYVNIIAKEN
ncbi:MAG: KH domain-containing protein [Firmicutes bacterium]|nr:KH domain-containing protein [Bacillota bacterium]